MIRWIWRAAPTPLRTLTEDQFIAELLRLVECAFEGAPEGPVIIESLDAQQRVLWRAYYRQPHQLLGLARQLFDERALRERAQARASGQPRQDPWR